MRIFITRCRTVSKTSFGYISNPSDGPRGGDTWVKKPKIISHMVKRHLVVQSWIKIWLTYTLISICQSFSSRPFEVNFGSLPAEDALIICRPPCNRRLPHLHRVSTEFGPATTRLSRRSSSPVTTGRCMGFQTTSFWSRGGWPYMGRSYLGGIPPTKVQCLLITCQLFWNGHTNL